MEGLRDDGNKNDVMVSNLPLLFADGNPTSLELMSAVLKSLYDNCHEASC